MLRPTPILRYLTVMATKGFAPAQVVDATGVDVAALDDPNYLIDGGQYRKVVENMLRLSGGEGLGLDIGLQRDIKDFGILGYAALSCGSIRQAVEEFWGRYGDALGMMAKISIPRGTSGELTLEICAASLSPINYRFFVEEALCLVLKLGAQVSGVETKFLRLRLGFPAPSYRKRYAQIFDCPIAYGSKHTLVTLHRSWFEMPLTTSNPELVLLYRKHLAQLRKQIEISNPLLVRLHSLLTRRTDALPALEEAAHELGLSPRTFRRQLQQRGQNYRHVIAAFRMESSLNLLETGNLPAKAVGRQVGYEDVNAFRRAFKKWTGKSITAYRAQHAADRSRVDGP